MRYHGPCWFLFITLLKLSKKELGSCHSIMGDLLPFLPSQGLLALFHKKSLAHFVQTHSTQLLPKETTGSFCKAICPTLVSKGVGTSVKTLMQMQGIFEGLKWSIPYCNQQASLINGHEILFTVMKTCWMNSKPTWTWWWTPGYGWKSFRQKCNTWI